MPAKLTKLDWAYLAGIIDGEGCISVGRGQTGAYYLQVRISQKNKEDLRKLNILFGGKFNKKETACQLGWYGKEAEPILRKTFAFLKWKKDEAELAISFIDQIMVGVGGRQDKELAKIIREELSAIKKQKYAARIS